MRPRPFESISVPRSPKDTYLDIRGRSERLPPGYSRTLTWTFAEAYLFNAAFEDVTVVEVQVNAEFGDAAIAGRHAAFYARAIGNCLWACVRGARPCGSTGATSPSAAATRTS